MYLQLKSNTFFALPALLLLALLTPCSQAVTISPVHLEMSVDNPISTFTVTNDSANMVTYQSNTLDWSQLDDKNIYIETEDLIVTPPIVTIEPQSSQTFRVALFKASPHLVEQSYRIVLDDITTYVSDSTHNGLSFIFSHNLPLFFAPLENVDSVVWSTCESNIEAKSCLLMENKGNRHAKMVQFNAISATQEEPNNLSKTVLAGSSGKWFFSTRLGSEMTTSITLMTDVGPVVLILNDLPHSNEITH
jgi:fimbrial chaperone protein